MTDQRDAAIRLLDREVPEDSLRERTAYVALPESVIDRGTKSIVIFRIGVEWLGLATDVFQEVAEECTVHTLPHRRGGIVAGLVNIRGELLLCVALETLLDRIQQILILEGLGQKFYGSGLHRFHGHGNIAVPADENNGDMQPGAGKFTLQIEAAEAWKADIGEKVSATPSDNTVE